MQPQEGKDWALNQLDQTVRLNQDASGDLDVGEALDKIGGVVIVLCEETQGDSCYWVVAPTSVKGGEKSPALLCTCVQMCKCVYVE